MSQSETPEDPLLAETVRDLGAGRVVFGRFRLVRELGMGGMAVVWLAQDERLAIEVALKFLSRAVAADPDALHDLRREITRGLRLTHPGIVRVYDLHEDQPAGLAAIAMEYVSGGSLADAKAAQTQRCLAVGEPLLGWLRTLCDALSYVHAEARLVHRDLKPRNLMLTAEGRLKVADFGIASTLSESQSRLTSHPGSSGTPHYMSPQQAAGRNPAPADDVYAVGAIIYELLTSKPPFFRGDMGLILHQAATETPTSMRERRAELGISGMGEIPVAWEETVAACLAKEPERRPGSAAEIARRLGLGSTVIEETAPTRVLPRKREASRLPWIGMAAGLALLALLVAGGWFWVRKVDSTREPAAGATRISSSTPAAAPAAPAIDGSTVVDKSARIIALRYEKVVSALFEEQMRTLQERGVEVVSLRDFLAWRGNEMSIALKGCLITFDQGLAEVYTVARPILGRYGYPYTVFVVVERIGTPGYLSWEQVAELQQSGAEIELNTAHYAKLTELDPVMMYHEIVDASIALEAKVQRRIDAIAYPFGLHNAAVHEMVIKSGLQAGFTSEGRVIEFSTPADAMERYVVEPGSMQGFAKAVDDLVGK